MEKEVERPAAKTSKRPMSDRDGIDINNPENVAYWCERFHCTRAELEMAVSKVGHASGDVEQELKLLKGA